MFVPDFVIAAVLVVLGATLGTFAALVVFVRRQRQALIQALNNAGKQQVATTEHLAAAIDATQRQQRQYEQQLQNLAQATLRLRQDVQILSKRGESTTETVAPRADRVLH